MINVNFKNVGQGDSIIIEWKRDSLSKIGIIDCNLIGNKNPTLEHIISSNYSEIDFIILSHPHYDHFSGLVQILEYCELNKITIGKFLHTSQQVPAYLRVATRSTIANNELVLLFKKINLLRKKGVIQFLSYIIDEIKDIKLNDELSLSFLAPSTVEYENFLSKTPLFDDEDANNNSQGNWLSTVLKFYTAEWYILLTSDATIQTLKRVGIQRKKEFQTNLRLGQSSHHGSTKNHNDEFWKTKYHKEKTPIVISVGKNSYQHPSKNVIDFFSNPKHNYKIFSTNQVGSLNAFISDLKDQKINAYQDLAGSQEIVTPKAPSQYQGDQSFFIY